MNTLLRLCFIAFSLSGVHMLWTGGLTWMGLATTLGGVALLILISEENF